MSTTQSYTISTNEFTQVASGSANVIVQLVGSGSFYVVVADALPDPDAPAISVGDRSNGMWESFALGDADNVYVRASNSLRNTVVVIAS